MTKDFCSSAKSFLTNQASNPTITILKCSSILALFGSIYLTYLLSGLILPKILSLLVSILFSYWILKIICRTLTFPGSSWLWKRTVENYFQNAFVKKVQKSVALLRTLLEYLLKEVPWNNFLTEEELIQIRMMISSLLNLFKKQQDHQTLTKRQKGLLEAFTGIEKLLSQTIVVNRADHITISLWKFLEENSDAQNGLELPNALLYFKDRGQGHFLLEKCLELEDKVNQITVPQTWFYSLKKWLFEDSFGTVDQVREEIQNRYESKQIFLQVDKRARLDCVYIAGRSPDEPGSSSPKKMSSGDLDSSYYTEFASRANKHLKSTIIICCPNSTYYEFLYYENEWIDIYVRNGINVFLWNYRGYGRSTGSPSLDNLKHDGEFIVSYLREKLGVQKIGAHGDSVGGIVASHIAKTQNLDFLCADRNFSSLAKMGEFFFGGPLMSLYKYLMLPTDNITEDYLDNNCYKVVTFDAKDEAVPLLASLKYRLTSKIIEQKLNFDSEYIDLNNPEKLQKSNFVTKFLTFARLENYNAKLERKTRDYYDLLNKQQTLALFWAFYRVSELFIPLSSLQTLPTTKQTKRPQSISEIQTNKGDSSPIKTKLERRGSLDSSFNVGMSKEPVYSCPDEPINSGRIMTTDESVVIPSDSKTFNESLDWRGSAQLDDASLIQTIKKRSYMELFGEDAQASADVVNLLVKIFAVFEDLEAGGIQISDVIATDEKYRFEVFRHFMQSFEIWGSYLPLHKIIEDEPKTLAYYQQNALNKLRGFIKKIDSAIHKQKQRPPLKSHTRLVTSIIEDLEIIASIMPYFYQKLSNKIENSTSTSLIGSSHMNYSRSGGVQIDLEDAPQTKNVGGGKFIPLQNDMSMHSHGITDSSYLGNLLPVTIGQSGSLKQNEVEVYEYHLRNSRMI